MSGLTVKKAVFIFCVLTLAVSSAFAASSAGVTEELSEAVKRSMTEEVTRLIKEGADVNAADKHGWTPLMNSVTFNTKPELLLLLLKSGADVGVTDKNGFQPLQYAERNKSIMGTDAYKALRERTLEGVKDPSERLYVLAPDIGAEQAARLIQDGADTAAKSPEGITALGYAEYNKALTGTAAFDLLKEKTPK